MSTKTLLKRLALGTVVALGASVLTVSAANADTANGGTITGYTAAGVSTGLVGFSGSGTGKTATLLQTGQLVITTDSSSSYVVSAGGIITTASTKVSADQSTFATASGDTNALTFTVKPTGAAGSTFTITGHATTATTGAVTEVLTVTIAGASVYGIPSPAKSYVNWVKTATAASGDVPNNYSLSNNAYFSGGTAIATDINGANSTTTGLTLSALIMLRDAYGNPVTTAGALTATVSSGANVGIGTASTTTGTYTTAVYGSAPTSGSADTYAGNEAGVLANITEATTGAGWAGTLTVSYNGITIATKSGTISGVVSKIAVTPLIVAHTNTTDARAFSYQAYDAAGNLVVATAGSLAVNANSNTAAVATLAGTVTNVPGTGVSGKGTITGGTTAGTAAISLKFTNALGAVIVSNTFNVTTGGAADSYTAKLDKSSYNQGDIATLTVKFLDSKGNVAASDSAPYAVSGSAAPYTWDASFATPMLSSIGSIGQFSTSTTSLAVTFPTDNNAASNVAVYADATGTLVYKFTVGSAGTFAAGNYNAVVDFPTVDAAHGSAQTAAYTLGSQGTSLNDVLKGIVSLIASINKQIAALAKLVAPAKKK